MPPQLTTSQRRLGSAAWSLISSHVVNDVSMPQGLPCTVEPPRQKMRNSLLGLTAANDSSPRMDHRTGWVVPNPAVNGEQRFGQSERGPRPAPLRAART